MASSIIITCPECEKQLKASSDVLGKKIRCKGCGATFVGRAAKDAAPAKKDVAKKAPAKKEVAKEDAKPAAKAPAPADDNDMTAYGVTHEYIGRRCPNCTLPMNEEQVVCIECGYNTTTRDRIRRVKVNDITTGDIFVWQLPAYLYILLSLVLVTLWLLFVFLVSEATFADQGIETWYDFLGGKALKIYSGLISLFIIYLCIRFAVKRLAYEPRPPEQEDKSRADDDDDEDD